MANLKNEGKVPVEKERLAVSNYGIYGCPECKVILEQVCWKEVKGV